MFCVCIRDCQHYLGEGKNKRVRTFYAGEVFEFEECPMHFSPLEGEDAPEADFATMGREELLAREFELEDLRKFIVSNFGRSPRKRSKEGMIDELLDARYRAIDMVAKKAEDMI